MALPTCRPPVQRLMRHAFISKRQLSTLKSNPYIYVHTQDAQTHILSYLPTEPPKKSLSIGTIHASRGTKDADQAKDKTTPSQEEPPVPTPQNLTPNPAFLPILHSVLKRHATSDPAVQASASAYVSAATASMGVLSPGNATSAKRRPRTKASADTHRRTGSGVNLGSSSAAEGGGDGAMGVPRGGWVHVSDTRNPPDWARVAWPEDIFGSLEVDGMGRFVDGSDDAEGGGEGGGRGGGRGGGVRKGRYQESGTYRIVTREGILGLSPFLRDKLIQRLRELEREE